MLTNEQINTIHRLHFVENWTVRKIARHLHIGRRTVAKYLIKPAQAPLHRTRTSKLDPFKPAIDEWLQQDSSVTAAVLFQRLRDQGFAGGYTIVKDHLQAVRSETKTRRAFVRMEPAAGERFEIDWGHFGALVYNGTPRKLYAFCLVECHSRKMYIEFTHSQTFETFARCHIHAFEAMGGVARELWFDNLLTVVAEHEGNLVRFNPRFLGFAREYGFVPRACHVAAAWEKGKVERAIGYVRQNFWPLRRFIDLPDVNSQAHQWLHQIANQRRHRETGQTPEERFRPECLRPLPAIAPDYRDNVDALVHKDLRLSFDGNRYCVPPRYVGRRLIVKADSSSVTIYDQHQEIVRYPRPWWRGHTFGVERFQKELFAQMAAAERSAAQHRVVALLGPVSEEYLRRLANTDRSLTRQVRELLALIRDYGPDAVAAALEKARAAGAFGADYIANILRQQQSRRDVQPPLQLKDPALNQLATDPLSLADTTHSSCIPERSPVNPLHQKLNQLSLTTMSQNLDQILTDAAAKNLSLAAALEALTDRELEARNGRAVERRFRFSRLGSRSSIDSFQFSHHKSRTQLKSRILRLMDLEFLQQGTNIVIIGNTGRR